MTAPSLTSKLFDLVDNRSTTGEHFYTNFDGLRALAALMVLAMHVYTVPFLASGAPGVFLFFGLSGFLLYTGFLSIRRLDSVALVAYLIRRIFRIIPLYAVFVLSFVYLFNDWSRDLSFTWSLNHLLFLHGKIHLWTVRAEMQFYMTLPLVMLLLVFFKSEIHRFVLLLIIAAVAMWLFADYFAMFFLGMAAVHARLWISRRSAVVLTYASLVSILVLSSYTELTEPVRNLLGVRHRQLMYDYGLVFFPLCFMLLLGVSRFESRLFGNRWLRLMGLCGYGIYLWHVPVMVWLREMQLDHWQFQISYYVLTIGWSILTYRFIELPGIRMGRVFARWVKSDEKRHLVRPLHVCLFLLALVVGFRSGFADPKIIVTVDMWSPVQGTSSMSVSRHGNAEWVDNKLFSIRPGVWQAVPFAWWDRSMHGLRLYLPAHDGMYRIRGLTIDFPFAEPLSVPLEEAELIQGESTQYQEGNLLVHAGGSAPILQFVDAEMQPGLNAKTVSILVFASVLIIMLLVSRLVDMLLAWWYHGPMDEKADRTGCKLN